MKKRFALLLLIIFSAAILIRADAMSDAGQRAYDRQKLCADYATGNPSTAVSDYDRNEKSAADLRANSNANLFFTIPKFSEKPNSYWTDKINSEYDADGAPTIGVEILVCKEAKQPRLLIPPRLSSFIRKDLKNLKLSDSAAPSRTQTLALGMLMSLAVVSSGVWLFRSKQSRNIKIIAVLGVATIGLSISTAILASADYGEALRAKQRIIRDLQSYNIAQDFSVAFYILEDRSDLRDVVLIVPLNYSKPKERPVRSYAPSNDARNSWANFIPRNSNFAVNSTPANAVRSAAMPAPTKKP